MKNIYNDVDKLLKHNKDISKSEIYFALNLWYIANEYNNVMFLKIPLRIIKSNISIFKEVCAELKL